MKSKILILILLINLFVLSLYSQENTWEAGEFLVQFDTKFKKADIEQFLSQQTSINQEACQLLSARMNAWLVVLKDRDADVYAAMEDFKKKIEVKAIQLNYHVQERETTPDDPLFSEQWPLKNTGASAGVVDADIDATDAWDITTGGMTNNNREIIIAIIDSGFQLSHPDLNFWVNNLETPSNGIDDDGNGYIDDYYGWNAYNQTGNLVATSHGTHVTGIASAKGNNTLGVSGINWNTKVMPVCGSSSTQATVVIAYGYVLEMRQRYNETNGQSGAYVVVTNSSFGADYGNPANYPIWAAMYDSLGVAGVLSCGATANANINVDVSYDMPTACTSDYLITVTNTTRTDVKYNGAGYGANSIDLGAPGTSVRSTDLNSAYSTKTGTSMSSPHVAGSVALMYAAIPSFVLDLYENNPSTLALMIKNYILEGVDSLSSLQGITLTGGRLNVNNSMQLMLNDFQALNPPLNLVGSAEGQSIVLNWQAPVPNSSVNLISYKIFRNSVLISTINADQLSYTDLNVFNGIDYQYYVTALYNAGESNASNSCSVVLLNPPVFESITQNGMQALLEWTDPLLSVESSLVGYDVYRNDVRLNQAPINANTYNDDDYYLYNGIDYHYYIKAVYAQGTSVASDTLDTVFLSPPTGLYGMASYLLYVVLVWNGPNVSPESQVLGVNIYRNGTLLNEEPYQNGLYFDSLLVNGLNYSYAVSVVYSQGESVLSNTFDFVFLNAPDSLVLIPGDLSCTLEWNAPVTENRDLLGYNVYRNDVQINESIITEPQYQDQDLVNGLMYMYRVRALYSQGESLFSDSVSVVFLGAPDNLTSQSGDGQVQLNWIAPVTGTDINRERSLLGYNVYRDSVQINTTMIYEESYLDEDVQNDSTYSYYVTAVYSMGESIASNTVIGEPEGPISNDPSEIIHREDYLYANYPNPFNPSTKISWSLKEAKAVNISIYNIKGQRVKELVNTNYAKGVHSVIWDGTDDQQKSLSSGIYYIRINAGTYHQVRKCLMIK